MGLNAVEWLMVDCLYLLYNDTLPCNYWHKNVFSTLIWFVEKLAG